MSDFPNIILLFSGKRKSGKDYITDKLKDILGEKCEILKISAPIKQYFSKSKGYDLELLMSDKPNKEQVRLEMIKWSEEKRAEDPGYFCDISCKNAKPAPIWIVSDIRRKTDIAWFYSKYKEKIKTIRIKATPDVRKQRGFQFQKGVDDAESECDLDNYVKWDYEIENNDDNTCSLSIETILNMTQEI